MTNLRRAMPALCWLTGSLLGAHCAVPPVSRATGSLSLSEGSDPLTFKYSTDQPGAKNWVGLWDASGGGPDNEEHDADSLVWEYAPDADGEVFLDAGDLEPGEYKAYYLADDGYKWLADPVKASYSGPSGPISFIVDSATLHNGRVGDKYEAKVKGLVTGGGGETIKFSLTEPEDGWAEISSDGSITGTPTEDGNTTLKIKATSSDGSNGEVEVVVPVKKSGSPLVDELKVMSFNIWMGGKNVNGYHNKQVRFLADSNVDIVGLQESTGDHATRLGNALGWYSWQGSDVGMISRYPIAEEYDAISFGGAIRIALDGDDSQVNFWNVHTGYDPYGPYDFCFDKMTVDEVMKREEESKRTPQIKEAMKAMKEQLGNADDIPVLLTGDFNAPSHLDWTKAAKDQHCGYYDVPWPTSKYPEDNGLVDSFRVAHPDPVKEPGITWSPIYLENEGRPEPMDRIDFVYHKGGMEVAESKVLVVGDPKPEPDQEDNEWPSDHAAVMTTFKVSAAK